MLEKQFYGARDILTITSFKSLSSCYQLIEELQKEFIEEYPDKKIYKKLIPIDYFNKKMLSENKTKIEVKGNEI